MCSVKVTLLRGCCTCLAPEHKKKKVGELHFFQDVGYIAHLMSKRVCKILKGGIVRGSMVGADRLNVPAIDMAL